MRHDVQTTIKSPFEVRMKLTIRNIQRQDLGSYRCAAKNSLGEMESNIRLYGEFELNTCWLTFPLIDFTTNIVYIYKFFSLGTVKLYCCFVFYGSVAF